jgi:hypothetical protein
MQVVYIITPTAYPAGANFNEPEVNISVTVLGGESSRLGSGTVLLEVAFQLRRVQGIRV